jgi:ferredoxin
MEMRVSSSDDTADHDAPAGAVGELRIDREMCQGHGRCYTLAPELFDCDQDGDGFVTTPWLTADGLSAARSALMACPERAISIRDIALHDKEVRP